MRHNRMKSYCNNYLGLAFGKLDMKENAGFLIFVNLSEQIKE